MERNVTGERKFGFQNSQVLFERKNNIFPRKDYFGPKIFVY